MMNKAVGGGSEHMLTQNSSLYFGNTRGHRVNFPVLVSAMEFKIPCSDEGLIAAGKGAAESFGLRVECGMRNQIVFSEKCLIASRLITAKFLDPCMQQQVTLQITVRAEGLWASLTSIPGLPCCVTRLQVKKRNLNKFRN